MSEEKPSLGSYITHFPFAHFHFPTFPVRAVGSIRRKCVKWESVQCEVGKCKVRSEKVGKWESEKWLYVVYVGWESDK